MKFWFSKLPKDPRPGVALKEKLDMFSTEFDLSELLQRQSEIDRAMMYKFRVQENTYVHLVEADSTTKYLRYSDTWPLLKLRMAIWAFFL